MAGKQFVEERRRGLGLSERNGNAQSDVAKALPERLALNGDALAVDHHHQAGAEVGGGEQARLYKRIELLKDRVNLAAPLRIGPFDAETVFELHAGGHRVGTLDAVAAGFRFEAGEFPENVFKLRVVKHRELVEERAKVFLLRRKQRRPFSNIHERVDEKG